MGWYAIKTHSDQSDTLTWRLASPIQYGAGTTWWLEFNGGHVNWQGKVCLTVSFTSIATNIENSGLSLQVLVPARWLPTKVPSRMEWLAAVFDKYTYYPPSWCTAPLTTNGLEVVNRHVACGTTVDKVGPGRKHSTDSKISHLYSAVTSAPDFSSDVCTVGSRNSHRILPKFSCRGMGCLECQVQ